MADQTHGYVVQASVLTPSINAGRLNKARTAFVSKDDVTDMALCEVARYVVRNFEGSMEAEYPNLDGGIKVTIKVEALEASDS